ncbi:MAG: tetratricopeptide repeat protein [Rhodospirillales bacterium]|nr:MAG: tetratricopeptide repeat protein [Rhodospirillales bacterium]
MFALEEPVRFSRSRLWELQRQFYQGLGPAAWANKLVPNTISTNAFMAQAYARVLAGYLQDLATGRAGPVDPAHPIHIVEIGAGSGRLGYLISRFLSEFAAPLAKRKKGPLFRYVLTDGVAANLEAWQRHPRLAQPLKDGLIDLALFDPANDTGITLLNQGTTLEAAIGGNPLALVANYAFDILPYDVFSVGGGRIFEHRVGLNLPEAPAGEIEGSPETLKKLSFQEEDHPAELPYYGHPVQDGILSDYAAQLPDGLVTFPVAALSCLERLAGWGQGRLLVLASDKARFARSQLTGRNGLGLSLDGAFAATVNLEAVSRAVAAWGGLSMARAAPNPRFDSYTFLLSPDPENLSATRTAVQDQLLSFGPQAYYSLLSNLRSQGAKAGLSPLLALLSLGKPDPAILFRLSKALLDLTEVRAKLSEAERRELLNLIRAAWDNRFELSEESNAAFHFARLSKRLGDVDQAVWLYKASLETGTPDTATWYNLGLCQLELGQKEQAQDSFKSVLALKPDHPGAAGKLAEIHTP